MSARRQAGAVALLALASACWVSAPSLTAPTTLTATIGTTPFVADTTLGLATYTAASRLLTITGQSAGGATQLTVQVVLRDSLAIGTYFIGCTPPPSSVILPGPADGPVEYDTDCLADGQLEITALDTTAHRIAGRFAFRGRLGTSLTLLQVSNGRFAGTYR